MEMTLLELEQAAVVPSLWSSIRFDSKSMPWTGDNRWLVYGTKRILRRPTGQDDGRVAWGNYLDGLFLVPGGRYLIIFFSNRLSVFDIGNVPDASLDHKARPLASAEIRFNLDFLVHPSPDGAALRIFVSVEPTIEEEGQMGVDQGWVASSTGIISLGT